MTSNDAKRSWAEQIEELDDETQQVRQKKSRPLSRENSRNRKKSKPNTEQESKPQRKILEFETDPPVLQRRQKQIDYGKNTVGYENYTQQVPLDKRTKEDPKTPDKYLKYSRRSWDTLIKMWRKKLHAYDPNNEGNSDCSDTSNNV